MALTREQILSAEDLRREEVAVPEWGGSVHVRTITAAERIRMAGRLQDVPKERFVFEVVALCACDESGSPLFTGESDAEALAGKATAPVERICEAAMRLNGMTPQAREDAAKN